MLSNFLDKIVLQEAPSGNYLPFATDETIKAAESELGSRLPESYKIWSKRFGAGELAGHFRIVAPTGTKNEFDLIVYNHSFHEGDNRVLWEDRLGNDFLANAIFFSETIGGEFYAFNRAETALPDQTEYRIYYIPRHVQPKPVSDSFFEWVRNVCLTPSEKQKWFPEWEFGRFLMD
jgi:hypothetical protein